MTNDFEIMTNSVVPANERRVILAYDEQLNHTSLTTLSYKGTADYQDGSTLSFSVPIAYKRLINLSYKQAKALAFLCLVRAYEQMTNNRCSYTINSLHYLTGVHAKTIEERIVTLEKMDLVEYDSKHRIVIRSAKAKHRDHNTAITIQLTIDEQKSRRNDLKHAETELLTARVVNKLKQINFHRDALNRYHEIKNSDKPRRGMLDEFKKLKRWLREHCKRNYDESNFKDFGWSFKSIADYLGTSLAKAFSIIKYAIENKVITKRKRFKVMKIYEYSTTDYIDHTYTSKGMMFKMYANSYCLNIAGTI